MTTENTGAILAGRFQPGQSGNPAGKPKGARHKTTLAVQALLEGEAETITRKAIELAKEGDMTAIRLVLERLLPPRKEAPISFVLPPVRTMEDVPIAMEAMLQATANGELTLSESHAIAMLLECQRKSIESTRVARQIEAIHLAMLARRPA